MKVVEEGLPGFHSSSVRFQMLSNFADLVKTNQFKIRSIRVINELETWIFKNGRIDHKDGCHDDTLTCLAMGLFVLEFSIKRQMKAKQMDQAMLSAMVEINKRINFDVSIQLRNHEYEKKNAVKPVYSSSDFAKPQDSYSNMWLLR